jgi:hypothetical protein
MLLRAYVQSPEEFERWAHDQQQTRRAARLLPWPTCLRIDGMLAEAAGFE